MSLTSTTHETGKSSVKIAGDICACTGDSMRLLIRTRWCQANAAGLSVKSPKQCRIWHSYLKTAAISVDEGVVCIGIWVQPCLYGKAVHLACLFQLLVVYTHHDQRGVCHLHSARHAFCFPFQFASFCSYRQITFGFDTVCS